MGLNFSCVKCVDSDSVDNLHKKEKRKRRKAKTKKTSSSQDQTSQKHVTSTSEAEVLSVAEEPGHAEVDEEWSDDAFQELVGDSSEWGADVLNSLSCVFPDFNVNTLQTPVCVATDLVVDVLQASVCVTSDYRVPVRDVAYYRANVPRVPVRDVADCRDDVPRVPVRDVADCRDDVPRVPVRDVADCRDDVPQVTVCPISDCRDDVPQVTVCATSDCSVNDPHVGPTGDTVSPQLKQLEDHEIINVGSCSYEIGRKLGEGGFGSVYAGVRLRDGLKVALKFADSVDLDWIDIEGNPEPVPQEIGLLILANKGPRVPQIIQLLDWAEEPERYIMVLELPTPCENLIEFLDRHEDIIEEDIAKVIIHQATLAAQTCCQRGVLHRDIKLENLLINPYTLEVKLIDFGCGEILTNAGYTSFAGTEPYCPPEYDLNGEYHGEPATVWSLGILLFALLCEEFPESEDLDNLNDNIWTKDGLSQECCELLCSLLQRKPEKRLELDNVCLHNWFKYFNFQPEDNEIIDQTSQKHVTSTSEAEVLSVAEEPGHAEVDEEWSDDAFQEVVGDLSEWGADVLNSLSCVFPDFNVNTLQTPVCVATDLVVDVLQASFCVTSDYRVPVRDVAYYRANVPRVPVRDVAYYRDDVPRVPVRDVADCRDDVPRVPVRDVADCRDDVPRVPVRDVADCRDDVPRVPVRDVADCRDDVPRVPVRDVADCRDDVPRVPVRDVADCRDDVPRVPVRDVADCRDDVPRVPVRDVADCRDDVPRVPVRDVAYYRANVPRVPVRDVSDCRDDVPRVPVRDVADCRDDVPRVPVRDVAYYRANVPRVPVRDVADCRDDVPRVPVRDVADCRDDVPRVSIRDVADCSVDVPQVPVSTTSAPGLDVADCCVDVPQFPVCAISDCRDDVPQVPVCPISDCRDDVPQVPVCATSDCSVNDPHVGPTGDTVSPQLKQLEDHEIINVGSCSYEIGRKLGEGGFGSVYAGVRLRDGLEVALKFIDNVDLDWIDIEGNPEPVPQEIGLLILANKGPRVPQIIQLLDWDEEPERYIMVLELPTPCENLIEFLGRHKGTIEEDKASVIMQQATLAAQTCCQRGVLRRDIKLENLLINPYTLEVKLIDFGCGEILTNAGYTSFAGTEPYCPPEYDLNGEYHGEPATVWSLGILLFALLCGQFPESEDLDNLNDNIWTKDGLSQECCKLLCSLLQRKPEKRLELDIVSLHNWFKYYIY